MRATNTIDLTALAFALESDGIRAHEDEIAAVVRRAHERDVASVAVDVLASRSEPEPARLRAFGSVVAAMS